MKKTKANYYLVIVLCLSQFNFASAGVLHWLSQIESDAGPVANYNSFYPKISTNGRYVTYSSNATNIVLNDNNGYSDVVLKDLLTGQTQLVTLLPSGQQFIGYSSQFTAMTSDGRYVAFVSSSDQLPNGVGSGADYIYLKDLVTGDLTNLSEYEPGEFFDQIGLVDLSDDAQYITFTTYYEISPLHTEAGRAVYRKNLSNGTFELLSIADDGNSNSDEDSTLLAVSDNNRYVLFSSKATNLTTDVLNNTGVNLFLRDTTNNTTTLINTSPSGASSADSNSSGYSFVGDVSNAGSVVFSSSQTDLVINDTNALNDLFYYQNGLSTLITLTPNGNQITDGYYGATVISGDGTRIVFQHASTQLVANDNNNTYDVFSYLVANNSISLVSKNAQNHSANNISTYPSISLNGNRVVYNSKATDLNNEPTSVIYDEVFAHQFSSQSTQKISVPLFNPHTILSGIPVAYGSSDQMTVVYSTQSNNLTTDPLNLNDYGLNDRNVYLLDRTTNKHQLITSKGSVSDISPSGQFVAFYSDFNQPQADIDLGSTFVFLYDRVADSYTQIAEGYLGKVNDEGKVVFYSYSALSNNDLNTAADVYYFNPVTANISLISQGLDGFATGAGNPDIGGTGNNTYVVFDSSSSQLAPADTNGFGDVFMKKLPNGPIFRVSQTAAGLESNSSSYAPSISNNGNYVSFMTLADNLTNDDYSQTTTQQILRYDRINTTLSLASKNDAGLPIESLNAQLGYSSVSDSGRYVAYPYTDFDFNGVDFLGDDDGKDDMVLFDTVSQTSRIISKTANGQNSLSSAGSFAYVMEDVSVSPPLVGVFFTARFPADLTGVSNHPGHEEAFLYQQGGPNLDFNIQVIGAGQVNGSPSISCQSQCNFSFALGTSLSLVANADPGMVFQGWQVDFASLGTACHDDNNPCDLIMDRNKTLTAVFVDPSEVIFDDGFELGQGS